MKPIEQYLAEQDYNFKIERLGTAVADAVRTIALRQIDRYCSPQNYAQARQLLDSELNEYLENIGFFKACELK
jgi:hypothetical protein